jgi:GDP-L-fucose synthase
VHDTSVDVPDGVKTVLCDLTDYEAVYTLFNKSYDVVFHLAANVGGISYNQSIPASIMYDNLQMGMNVIRNAALSLNVGKLVVVGSACSYPKYTPCPMVERNLWEGYPETSNGAYGVAKRVLHSLLEAYCNECGLIGAYPILANLYGPGDDFSSEDAHVIPSLIRKFHTESPVTVWGTGVATRDFLYVEDAADALLTVANKVCYPAPYNIGTGRETSIRFVVEALTALTGYKGGIIWDNTKPDGQPQRVMSTTLAKLDLSWQASTSIITGLERTNVWYEQHYTSHSDDI